MSEDRILLIDEIRSLLALKSGDTRLERAESTLTDGYAHALALEAKQRRIEQRMEVQTDRGDAAELLELARQASATRTELAQLRVLLVSLRDRVRKLRSSVA